MSNQVDLQISKGLATITINRPDKMNAFTPEMIAELTGIVGSLAGNTHCRVVALRHAGRHFCSGADAGDLLGAAAGSSAERSAAFQEGLTTQIHPLVRAFRALPQPVVIAARGHAIGLGVQLLLLADLVAASQTLRITLPQVKLAHVLDHGESYLLPRKIGRRKAMELALLGESMNATDAERFGLVNFLVPDLELDDHMDALIARLLRLPPAALLHSKAVMRESESADLESQLETERMHAAQCAAMDDFVEAMTALHEKREAVFQGR